MKSEKTSNIEVRGYISPTPGLPLERQRQMAADAGCRHVYEHRPYAAGEPSQLDRWMQSLRAGDTAWLPSVLCLVAPVKGRPEGYRPLATMCAALNRILATGAIIVDARAGITSETPETWANHVSSCAQRVSSGTRTTASRIKALRKGQAASMPGIVARWHAPAMSARLKRQRVIWTSALGADDVRAHLDPELAGASTRTLYAILGPRRPNDPGAGGRGKIRGSR